TEDDAPGDGQPAVVISHGMWRRRFGGDAAIVGSTLLLDGRAHTVVGVAGESFKGLGLGEPAPEFWTPTGTKPAGELSRRGSRGYGIVGRLKAGVTTEAAQTELRAVFAHLARAYPETNLGTLERPHEPRPVAVVEHTLTGPQGRKGAWMISQLLLAVVGLVLLIACANVANLLLARASARRREIAIRLALGAGRWRLVRQLLTESTALALIGGALGLFIALWTSDLLPSFFPQEETAALDFSLDARVLLFTLLLSIVTGLLFGLVPALQSTRPDLIGALKDDTAGASHGLSRFGLRGALVVAQVAISLVLLVSAGLFLRSLRNALNFDPGFDSNNLLLTSLEVKGPGTTREQAQQFYDELLGSVRELPGVKAASLTHVVPLSGGGQRRGIIIEGYEPRPGEDTELNTNVVGPDFFQTMGIPLLAGRTFDGRDRKDAPAVVVVNEEFARRYYPGQDAVGKRLRTDSEGPFMEIVGVARTARYRNLREQPLPFVYIPFSQEHQRDMTLVVRTGGDPLDAVAGVRTAAQGVSKSVPLFNVTTMARHVGASIANDRMVAVLLGIFGGVALLLAVVGIYGVMSYAVARRTHEIGVRMALGAQRSDILNLVIRQGMAPVLVGGALGLAAAFALTRVMSGLLFGVSATDPGTFAGVALLLAGVALLACYIPARRAARVDPLLALRHE
ncbi:MAG: ABC transporter permease, partial [Acidobacteria bacterium]|nr:ABC transporter permease [Acidobacteriota bacterium]